MASKMAYDFVLDYLVSLNPKVKPMFGSHAVYVGEKIMLITRDKETHEDDNGVWVATSKEHHESLKKDFPNIRTIHLLSSGKGETDWRNLPSSSPDFEEAVIRICELISKGDERIGRIPKPRAKKKS